LDPQEKEAAIAAHRQKSGVDRQEGRAGAKEEAGVNEGLGERKPKGPNDGDQDEMRKKREMRRAEIIKRFDTNGDGKLDADEKEAAKAAHRKNREANGQKQSE
jgi:hypothetical protein